MALASALASVVPAARAASWFVEPGLTAQVTATNNADFDTGATRESDAIVLFTPSVTLRGEGRRLRVAGAAALSSVTYLEETQRDRFDPSGNVSARLEAIEEWFFVDASLTATRSVVDPLGPRIEEPSGLNRRTEQTARVSPYLEREFANRVRLLVRSDNAWTRATDGRDPVRTEYAARHALRLSREPRPFGWALEGERRRDDRIELTEGARDWYEIARLRVNYAFGDQVVLGLRAGYERSDLFLGEGSSGFFGAELLWRPSPRSLLEGYWEDRTFGGAWSLAFTHRSPRVAWDFRGTRDLTTYNDATLSLPATADLAALIDESLRTRIADPIERARAVEEFIAQRGLPRSLAGPINVFSERILIRTSHTGTAAWIGTRSTVALTGFYRTDVTPPADLFSVVAGQRLDTRQRGAALALTRRLSPTATAVATASWSLTRGAVGLVAAGAPAPMAESVQRTFGLQIDRQLARRTTVFAGARYRKFDSTVIADSSEAAVYAGVGHRF